MKENKTINYRLKALKILNDAGIILNENDKNNLEITDFGLNDFEKIGLLIITYINTERVCAKELILLPNQTCPEHLHPTIGEELGKEETFRCRKGKVYLYVEGIPTNKISVNLPNTKLTVFHEIILNEGEQYTIYPNTLHWFQAGPEGAIISEFSTKSTDELDVFTDNKINRMATMYEK